MLLPVFSHTLKKLSSIIRDENASLSLAVKHIIYDPGLSFSLLLKAGSLTSKPVSNLSKAVSLLGAKQVELHILSHDLFMQDEYSLLWSYITLASETSAEINELTKLTDEESARLIGALPGLGIILMSTAYPQYIKIFEQMLEMPSEDRFFIEQKLFPETAISMLLKTLKPLHDFAPIIELMHQHALGGLETKQDFTEPSRLSEAYNNFRLFKMMEIANASARAILFPSVVEALEKCKELAKRYFRFFETEFEELLSDVVIAFDNVCQRFEVGHFATSAMKRVEIYVPSELSFTTTSKELNAQIEELKKAYEEGRNIFIYGEAGTGKRLLVAMIHEQYRLKHKVFKPFISVHCSTLDRETLEVELLGARGGFMWFERKKGALELANGGVLMLKDVDKIPIELQEHLSNIFAKDSVIKVGDTTSYEINLQLILTSKKDIFKEAKEGRFSRMLLDVIDPLKFYIPALRERRQDITLIADNIIKKYRLNLSDLALRMGLQEYYETMPFINNLKDLKRLLFLLSAKNSLKS